ncbi:MAG: TRAP transporter permease [Spirochaetia bacterium]
MDPQHQKEMDEQLEQYIQEENGVIRDKAGFQKYLISIIALSWALFQLALPSFILLDTITVRAIHLAFAIGLVFLGIPATKKVDKEIPFIHSKKRIPILDFFLGAIAVTAVLYIVFNWEGISSRAGLPNLLDIVFGVTIIIMLFEASRRAIGLPMIIISLFFSIYAFLGPYLPGVLAYRGVSMSKYVSQVALSTEGIYGIPLDVSATTVYLFVLFGSLLDRLGAGHFFNDLAISLLGRFKGGPAKASVVSSGFTGLVSGSSIANVVTTGTFTIPLMKKVGYSGKTAAATEVAASTNGQLMPPIMGAAAFIIAEYLGMGYFEVVRAAFVPAFVSYIALFYITHLEASKLGMKGLDKEDIPGFRQVLKDGFYHLIPLTILIFDLAVMRRSPNLAVFNAIVILAVTLFIKEIWHAVHEKRSIPKALWEAVKLFTKGLITGSKNMIPVALATATAGIIVGIVNMGIGSMIVQIVEVLSMGNIFLLLFITAVVSLIIGMGLPTTATYIVMASITVPVITRLGGDMEIVIPAIAAHLFCFYFGILADDTPPVGLAAYAAAAIANSDPIPTGIKGFIYDMRTAVIPFMFIFNAELLLVGVQNFWQGLLIFFTATLGTLAFTNAVQGWGIIRNAWWDAPLFLGASLMFFLPGPAAGLFGMPFEMRYLMYIAGALLYAATFLQQHFRQKLSSAVA